MNVIGDHKPKIAVTMGDPAGVGPELCLRVLSEPRVLEICSPVVFGDRIVVRQVSSACKLPEPPHTVSLGEWRNGGLPDGPVLVNCAVFDEETVKPGTVDRRYGRAAYAFIETAIEETLASRCAAVATAPLHKEALRLAGIQYPGHTEIFAALTGSRRSCMMLTSPEITASFVTTHVGVSAMPDRFSVQRVLDVIELTHEAMKRLRGRTPRLAVCGLNPHAGEHGLFGDEEARFIEPAIAQALAAGIDICGPLPPDAAFLPLRRDTVDAFICMYHDQGHIPFKMLAFDTGVNVTLGLPIVRTSVDHGTAFDIAWTGRASATSLIEAIRCAVALSGG